MPPLASAGGSVPNTTAPTDEIAQTIIRATDFVALTITTNCIFGTEVQFSVCQWTRFRPLFISAPAQSWTTDFGTRA
jgi:hypothetical protein